MDTDLHDNVRESLAALSSGDPSRIITLLQSNGPTKRTVLIEALRSNAQPVDLINALITCYKAGHFPTCISFADIVIEVCGPSFIPLKVKYVAMLAVDTLRYYREAIETMEQVLTLAPDDRDTLWNLGQYGFWGGDDLKQSAARSIRCYQKLIELGDPKVGELHRRIAEAHAERLEYDKVKLHYTLAKQADPSLAERVDPLIADAEALHHDTAPKANKPIISRYPNQHQFKQPLHDFIYKDASHLFEDTRFITRSTKFFTIGSCFAQNICHYLRQRGYTGDTIPYSEHINSTHANRVLIDWLFGDVDDSDPNFAKIEKYIVGEAGRDRQSLLDGLRNCDVFIYSLGVAAGFFRQDNGAFVMPGQSEINQRALGSTFRFRTTTVEENVENLRYILARLSELNPAMRVVLTVSPVPLRVSFEHRSAILADCVSKSTLRVACNEIVQRTGGRYIYWPSFEYVRWLSGHVAPAFGVDDDNATHISIEVLDSILRAFLKVFSVEKVD